MQVNPKKQEIQTRKKKKAKKELVSYINFVKEISQEKKKPTNILFKEAMKKGKLAKKIPLNFVVVVISPLVVGGEEVDASKCITSKPIKKHFKALQNTGQP